MGLTPSDYDARGWDVLPCFTQGAQIPYEFLEELQDHPQAAGKSSWGTRNMLYALILSMKPKRVLEIGTHIGSASVVMGTALKANGFGELICLEPGEHYQKIAQEHVDKAGLGEIVRIVGKFSYDPTLKEEVFHESFDLIFLDATHTYEAASFDIKLAADNIADNGLIVLDDVGAEESAKIDETGKGGVRQALIDFQKVHGEEYKAIFFEFPFWLNPMGMAMLCKQQVY